MKTRKQKQSDLGKFKEKLSKAKLAVFTSFARQGEKGLNVSALRTLKKSLMPLDAEYTAGKKTIIDQALRGAKKDRDVFAYAGSLGVMFAYGDEPTSAKALYQFARKNSAMKLFGAYLGSEFLDEKRFIELAQLPSKEGMIGRLVGMLSYPMRGLVVTLNEISKTKHG